AVQDYLSYLYEVLYRLEFAGLKLKPTKYFFFYQEIKVLGHIVNSKSIGIDTSKLCSYYQLGVVLEGQAWSEPAQKELCSIHGIDNLFTAKQITPFVLFHMYDEGFSILLEEVKAMKESIFNELLNFANELLGSLPKRKINFPVETCIAWKTSM
ncbi:11085_t:CDS:2, partial [Gigaspora rosea]